jgi:DNA-directed RNA polymerase subunit H (RpoH/RPB5)
MVLFKFEKSISKYKRYYYTRRYNKLNIAMDIRSIEYTIYGNLLKWADIIGYRYVGEENEDGIKKEKKDLIKTLQFYSYIKIKTVAKENEKEIMYIFLISDSVLVSKSLEFKKLLNTIPDKEAHVVIVSREGIKTPVKKFMNNYTKKNIKIKNLLYSNFKVDVRDNIMVPAHILCTIDETKKAMEDNKIESLIHFPKIKLTDPQVLWVGGKPGQLIKIIRKDVTGETLYYRVIV